MLAPPKAAGAEQAPSSPPVQVEPLGKMHTWGPVLALIVFFALMFGIGWLV